MNDVQSCPACFFRLDARSAPENKAASNVANMANLFRACTRGRARFNAHVRVCTDAYIMLDMLGRLDTALFYRRLRASNLTSLIGRGWTAAFWAGAAPAGEVIRW